MTGAPPEESHAQQESKRMMQLILIFQVCSFNSTVVLYCYYCIIDTYIALLAVLAKQKCLTVRWLIHSKAIIYTAPLQTCRCSQVIPEGEEQFLSLQDRAAIYGD